MSWKAYHDKKLQDGREWHECEDCYHHFCPDCADESKADEHNKLCEGRQGNSDGS